jgi:hypothetical protein
MNKNIVFAMVIIFAAVLFFIHTRKSSAKQLKGDINGDGIVDDKDRKIIERMILGIKKDEQGNDYTAEQIKKADLNGDGKISLGDLIIIDNIISGD